MQYMTELQDTINAMVQKGRGILAADESSPTIAKRFAAINAESTEENRRVWRSLLVTTTGLGEYISGIILYEETLGQKTDAGLTIPEAAWVEKIVPGIKVDKGKIPLALSPGDLITEGLDGLGKRLQAYKPQGARFAKWREVYAIEPHAPTRHGIEANAEMLARYAAVCQAEGVVPIVEPEVLMDGSHDIDRCAEVTEAVQQAVFAALHRHGVVLELMILKPNMILPGQDCRTADPDEVAAATLKVLRRTVPAAVPSINFLSGGQSPEEATANLNALNQQWPNAPWQLSISYGRALQQTALQAWGGKPANIAAAQQALLERARLNHLAMLGNYQPDMERGN
ncbi:fructose-bisphosphate aldolase class I [Pseudomaricurvus alcaniphilus]|uniref:class I fructose-bisphosphate aldolase n=1 Tax=Pseudomaricurvus alcaniphilus TaxID=1166482 RepID=UPI00140D8EA4|nr:class I fructose-bisphosphate aldolase [Pseudomaricurvus alcaniphilus]NHN35747.1 fructose-bisphosphate aldolase class I [Pseudomaricurvus alcaniphilus]